MVSLRHYQQEIKALSGTTPGNVLIQADTGSGKTRVLAAITDDHKNVILIAHRNILIKQISRELAQHDIRHNVLATEHTRRLCITEHRKFGVDVISVDSSRWVCSIDSLLSRYRRCRLTLDTQREWLIIVDEAHHMVESNKWGKLAEIFPNSRFIGATATACRLDQVSLARGDGGLFDELIQAPSLQHESVRRLIELGFLSDFECYSLPERIDSGRLKLGMQDYTYKSLSNETGRVAFEMAGDAVTHYRRLADGKQALAFCVNIEIAKLTAEKFKHAGIAAAAIHSNMSSVEVVRVFDLFERRVIQVLCNVDMIGEGVDVPAIEALIMLRKTASFGLYRQWVGRSLRPETNKPYAILIDHTGNILSHGLPDKHIDWDLKNPPQAVKNNLFPCPMCRFLVKAWTDTCPKCGHDIRKAVNAKRPVDVQYINFNLVELMRHKIDEQAKAEAYEKDLRENLQIARIKRQTGTLETSLHKLKLWFADVLQTNGVSIYDLNMFFSATDQQQFWTGQFIYSDVKNNRQDKCLKVYKKWLKSQ